MHKDNKEKKISWNLSKLQIYEIRWSYFLIKLAAIAYLKMFFFNFNGEKIKYYSVYKIF